MAKPAAGCNTALGLHQINRVIPWASFRHVYGISCLKKKRRKSFANANKLDKPDVCKLACGSSYECQHYSQSCKFAPTWQRPVMHGTVPVLAAEFHPWQANYWHPALDSELGIAHQ